ncbi:MAG: LLM class flavin-dependent oxidoreductase [Dehalococcoidia bacterium]
MVRFGLWYDFRNPHEWRRDFSALYAETIEQMAWAESLGFDDIWTTEHHFVEDGYSPSLMAVCAAIAAKTTKVRVGTSVLLALLHDPVRLAEDAATVDIISEGRLDLGIGLGYRAEEWRAFGVDPRKRGAMLNEHISVVRAAWAEGPFTLRGEFFGYEEIDVTPKPVQSPMPLWVAGLSEPAVKRAARLGDGFLAGAGEDLIPVYLAERARRGKPAGMVNATVGFHAVADDPAAAWAVIGPHIFYQRKIYAAWLNTAGTAIWPVPETIDEIIAGEPDIVVTPERAVEIISQRIKRQPEITHLTWNPVVPGLSPDKAAPFLETFATRVIPAVKRASGSR